MKRVSIIVVLLLAALARAGLAQGLPTVYGDVTPIGWIADENAYSAAARDIDSRFFKGTQPEARFSPESLASQVEASLTSELDRQLQRQLGEGAEDAPVK